MFFFIHVKKVKSENLKDIIRFYYIEYFPLLHDIPQSNEIICKFGIICNTGPNATEATNQIAELKKSLLSYF